MSTNGERTERARHALAASDYIDFEDLCIRDLLTDLRHLCDAERVDWAAELRMALGNYDIEALAEYGMEARS